MKELDEISELDGKVLNSAGCLARLLALFPSSNRSHGGLPGGPLISFGSFVDKP